MNKGIRAILVLSRLIRVKANNVILGILRQESHRSHRKYPVRGLAGRESNNKCLVGFELEMRE